MKAKTWAIVGLVATFLLVTAWALLREVRREEATLAQSISGVLEVDPRLYAQGVVDIVRTDRVVLMLIDPATRRPVALRFETPLVPPQNIRIGLEDVRIEGQLSGDFLLVGITDKDGEIFRVSPGEVYGRSPEPIALGSTQVRLLLDEPFRGSLFNETGTSAASPAGPPPVGRAAPLGSAPGAAPAGDADPAFTIAGTIIVSQALQTRVSPQDRVIVLLFDPDQPQPVAFKIIPHTLLPQRFSITLPPQARANPKPGYNLRVVTDKDENPFGSAEGELVGRSAAPIPLGTTDLVFELDQPYVR